MSDDAPSLEEFALQEKLKDCAICQLPDEVRRQVEAAVDSDIPRRIRIEWLSEIGHDHIDSSDFSTHFNGHHPRLEA